MKHWHIMMGNSLGIVLAEKKYTDAQESIDEYLNLVFGIFPGRVSGTRLVAHHRMLDLAEKDEQGGVFISADPLRLVWMFCYDDCRQPLLN